MYHILRGDRENTAGLRLDIDLPIFFKAIDEAINESVNAQKMQSKQKQKG
jgi:hypothetical protein